MKGKCPRCGTEYDILDKAASEAIGGLCAACWCDWHEKNIRDGRELEARRGEGATLTES